MKPLNNIKVIELAGLAPLPLCGMILSDYGAKVIRVDNINQNIKPDILNRGKRSIFLDLKQDNQRNILLKMLKQSDVLLDPYRPGVLEKLNLCPIELQKENPGLIVARLTGYGQPQPNDSDSVLKQKFRAGHDLNYIALSGLLSKFGSASCDTPQFPLNIIADFAGGGLTCVMGIILALLSRERTGRGEIIDVSMTLASAYLSTFVWHSQHSMPYLWPQPDNRGCNLLDGGAPFYRCYRTNDDKFVAVAALEPQFYASLLQLLNIPASEAPQNDIQNWPDIARRFGDIFASKSQRDWIDSVNLCGDCCVTPVLELDEVAKFWPDSFCTNEDRVEPLRQPRFASDIDYDALQAAAARPKYGQHTEEVLAEFGCSREEIDSVLKLTSKI